MPSSLRWTWLFPLTYAVHVTEELFAGEHFYNWVSRVAGAHLSRADFLTINAVALVVMSVAVFAINTIAGAGWLVATLGFVVAFNGSLHVLSSIVTSSYSPGTVSGLFLWIPLGIYALRKSRRTLPHKIFQTGIVVGILVHALVFTLALLL